jgi:hypothetical protein
MWERRDGGYFIVADEMVKMAIDFNEQSDRQQAGCAQRGEHLPSGEGRESGWVVCNHCGIPLERPDGGPVALPSGGPLSPGPPREENVVIVHQPGCMLDSVDWLRHAVAAAGQQAAAAKGNHGGRPEVIDDDMLLFARALKDKGTPIPEIAKKLSIKTGKNAGKHPSVASLYDALAEAGSQHAATRP